MFYSYRYLGVFFGGVALGGGGRVAKGRRRNVSLRLVDVLIIVGCREGSFLDRHLLLRHPSVAAGRWGVRGVVGHVPLVDECGGGICSSRRRRRLAGEKKIC